MTLKELVENHSDVITLIQNAQIRHTNMYYNLTVQYYLKFQNYKISNISTDNFNSNIVINLYDIEESE